MTQDEPPTQHRKARREGAGWFALLRGEVAFWALALALGVLVSTAARAAIYVAHSPGAHSPGAHSPGADSPTTTEAASVAGAFVRGLRFDAAAWAYLLVLVAVTSLVLRLLTRGARGLESLGVALGLTFATLVAVVDWHFFGEFGAHLDFVALEYLDDPGTTLGMIGEDLGTGLLTASVLGVVVLGLAAWGGMARRAGKSFSRRFELRGLWGRLLVLGLLFVVLRGGLGRPIRPTDAAFCADRFTNQLVLNGLFTLERAAYEAARGGSDAGDYGVEPTEAVALARSWIAPGTLFENDTHPALRREVVGERRPLNVVVVVLESFAGRHVGALGARFGLTPSLDSLAKEGLLFQRFYANGPSTNRSLPAILAGIPCLPVRTALTKSTLGAQPLLTFGTILRDAGYRTAFCTAGEDSWENLGGWCRNQGFDVVMDRSAFDESEVTSVFGVPDHVLLDRAAELCGALADQSNFGLVVLTSTNHPPFAVPDELPAELVGLPVPEGMDERRAIAFRYADWAVARFIRDARETHWGKDTLFVLVGDHGLHFAPQADIDLDRRHVPLLLLAPASLGLPRGARDTLGSHVDVLPTVLNLLGLEGPHAAWGRDLFATGDARRFAVLGPHGGHRTFGLLTGGQLLVDHLDGGAELYPVEADGRTLRERVSDPERAGELGRAGRAYLQSAHRALLEHRAGGLTE